MKFTLSLLSLAVLLATLGSSPVFAFERTEQRQPCAHYSDTRMPLFGDLHVHTSYSFDSYVSSQRNDPWAAYRYAKGEPIMLSDPDANQVLRAQIQRPLDFTSVTDHSEFLGPIDICTQDPGTAGYWLPMCMMTRSEFFMVQLLAASYWSGLGVAGDSAQKEQSFVCTLSDCDAAHKETWSKIQQAAEDHYDRSSDCSFTTFVGYEYTDAPNYKNLHRNVIFRNERVTDTVNEQQAQDRLFFEPVVELIQHKAASECRYDRLAGRGLDTEDEACDFEQVVSDNLSMLGTVFGEVQTETAAPVPLQQFGRRNMVRNALKDGLALGRSSGTNPFKMGFIGSTDTHSATPGGAEENNYMGHLGRRDAGYRNVQDHFYDNPGGLAVVWAEENSRDAIFSAIRRKETYATSGTRPVVRFFAGSDLPADSCQADNMIEQAYASGVPMGGELSGELSGDQAPRFLVSAMKDPGSPGNPGTDLQRVQIIKGWLDVQGNTHEQVFDVAGDANNGADVDPQSCAPRGAGFDNLCTVWQDPGFSPSEDAFYYARVLENPSCRWTTLQCQAAGVNPFAQNCADQAAAATAQLQDEGAIGDVYGKCCLDPAEQPFYSPVIQERAWTSPIWYQASGVKGVSANQ